MDRQTDGRTGGYGKGFSYRRQDSKFLFDFYNRTLYHVRPSVRPSVFPSLTYSNSDSWKCNISDRVINT